MIRALVAIALVSGAATAGVFRLAARSDLECVRPEAVGTAEDRCPETRAHHSHEWVCVTDTDCAEEDRAWRAWRATRARR